MKLHNTIVLPVILFCLLVPAAFNTARAQATVTFQVNLKPQLEDSVFLPGRDRAEITGNLFPLSHGRTMLLEDTEPVDSVYSLEVRFPRSATGKKLTFYYMLTIDSETNKESMPRSLEIRKGAYKLDALYFGSYAW